MNDKIIIRGARVNNLKNIDLDLPRNKMIVMTGLSGSGKTSLAFDTIYAEGQRRYVESLSSYARQFLGGVDKPDVDVIEGLSPAIAIDQKTTSNNPRSTVATITEIYDYLRLLYARCGIAYCPNHNMPIEAMTVSGMVRNIMTFPDNERMEILANVVDNKKGTFKDLFDKLKKDGYIRLYVDNELYDIDNVPELDKNKRHGIDVVIDRIVKREGIETRLNDSLETALRLTDGTCVVKHGDRRDLFSAHQACPICGFTVPRLEPRLFSFNSPLGACEECKGLGVTMSVDLDYLMPDKTKSIAEGGIRYYKNIYGTNNLEWQNFATLLKHYGISETKPLNKMTKKEMEIILYGSDEEIRYSVTSTGGTTYNKVGYIEGVKTLIERRFEETQSKFGKEYYGSFMTESECQKCHGARLNEKVLAVKVGGLNIYEMTCMSITKAYEFLQMLKLDPMRAEIARTLLNELNARLRFLKDVGLDYLTLDRNAGTLSGGEAQRIRLATQIGSALTGVLYVLDEPSIGLHQKDNAKLIATLKKMRDLDNTVIVVEHDGETMLSSDYIVDIGPGAGKEGGEVVFCGTPEEILKDEKSITGQYLSFRKEIPVPKKRRKGNGKSIKLIGAKENNLKNIDVSFPLGKFICVTGVSGSGKSSLVIETLTKSIMKSLDRVRIRPGRVDKVEGLKNVDKIVYITQDPIGRTPRSNPATYTGVFDDIRDLYAMTPDSMERGYSKSRYSFNVPGGRCEACQGDGVKRISMLFIPDVYVECEECHGKRYNSETLEVKYRGKNIYDVLKMSVKEALEFFKNHKRIKDKLQVLYDVGLGYIELGQSATTLSGGEAQRVKLASELQKKPTGKTVFVLDEPTTGLHMDDVLKLIRIIDRIVDNGDTVIVIEHNLDVIKCADYIIDLGPDGGDRGGEVIVTGTPEEVAKNDRSYTGEYLRKVLGDKHGK
ncbi:MAG: excinuclease ABC subunit UvrA [Erysipelotrichaceae bacterium]|nr:excinuclease ABC subunit UvrA [Erysipelotrichaceae bacterium]